MESWLLGTKLAIVLFVAVRWTESGTPNGATVVLLVLTYVALSSLYPVVRPQAWKRALISLSLVLSVLSALFYSPLFALFIPLTGAELVIAYSGALRFAPVPAVLGLLPLPTALWAEYLLGAALSLMVLALATRSYGRLDTVVREIEALRTANELQRRRIVAGEEYEHQVRRVVQLEERNRLAQEVHDRVGHAIAGSIVQIEAARALLESDPARAGRMMERSAEVLREGMESIRSTLRGIKPQAEELGIGRLRSVLDRFTATSAIPARLSYTGNAAAIAPARWAVIIDNTREALTNVVKHSGASRVTMRIEILAKLVKVEVRDDGRGTYSVKKGLGIRGIEERTQQEGGTLIIDGSSGFSLIMLFPRTEERGGD